MPGSMASSWSRVVPGRTRTMTRTVRASGLTACAALIALRRETGADRALCSKGLILAAAPVSARAGAAPKRANRGVLQGQCTEQLHIGHGGRGKLRESRG